MCAEQLGQARQSWGHRREAHLPRLRPGVLHPAPGTHAVQLALLPQVEGVGQLLEGVLQVHGDEGSQDGLGGEGTVSALRPPRVLEQLSQPGSTSHPQPSGHKGIGKLTEIVFGA